MLCRSVCYVSKTKQQQQKSDVRMQAHVSYVFVCSTLWSSKIRVDEQITSKLYQTIAE